MHRSTENPTCHRGHDVAGWAKLNQAIPRKGERDERAVLTMIRTKLTLSGLLFAVGLALASCGQAGVDTYETGISVDSSDFTEIAARGMLSEAVAIVCQEESLGVTGLASVLRIAETARASQSDTAWVFTSGGDRASVTASGLVSGDLLKTLTSDC